MIRLFRTDLGIYYHSADYLCYTKLKGLKKERGSETVPRSLTIEISTHSISSYDLGFSPGYKYQVKHELVLFEVSSYLPGACGGDLVAMIEAAQAV